MRVFTVILLACLAVLPAGAAVAVPMPELVNQGGQYHLMVDGRPFLMLGGQASNSAASSNADLAEFYELLVKMNANTAEVPVYWELVEPAPGKYDFTIVDKVIEGARKADVKLVILWFATYKNGESHYAPEWVKRDTKTYPRVVNAFKAATNILSPLCAATRDADARAFAAVLDHISKVDSEKRTVIMIQVENEPGFLGTDRDYSPEAETLFAGQVPADLPAGLSRAAVLSKTMRATLEASSKVEGTWRDVFGSMAEEAFSAYHVSRYVDAVAGAGKNVYPLPMYVNVWLVEPGGERAGEWPSGGATEHVMDIWKYAAPHLDIIAPDIYFAKYHDYCEEYARPDNPLFVPEANMHYPFFAAYPVTTLVRYNGLGFSPFGLANAQKILPLFGQSFAILRPLLPLIEKNRYTDNMKAFIQGVSYGEDWAHAFPVTDKVAVKIEYTSQFALDKGRGWGLIIKLADDDYLFAGVGYKAAFRALEGPPRDVQTLSIETGGADEKGAWVPTKRLNGDENDIILPEEGGALRVRILHP